MDNYFDLGLHQQQPPQVFHLGGGWMMWFYGPLADKTADVLRAELIDPEQLWIVSRAGRTAKHPTSQGMHNILQGQLPYAEHYHHLLHDQ